MSQSPSPHLLTAAEIFGDSLSQETQKSFFRAELPVRPQTSPCALPPSSFEAPTAGVMPAATFSPSHSNFIPQTAMALDSGGLQLPPQGRCVPGSFTQDLSAFGSPTLFAPEGCSHEFAQQSQHGIHYSVNYPPGYASASLHDYDNVRLHNLPNHMATSYPPATFYHSQPGIYTTPSLPETSMPELMQLGDDYDAQYGNYMKQEARHDYPPAFSDMSRGAALYSTSYEEDDPIDKEQPYAQLIYRALLAAPNHTMILRDIYDWFKKHTDKASHSETKGWQNSIRHNLSMNGAFEKVDSPTDSMTKGFMWRLTPAALREGVKSTTRYRTKASHRRSPHRNQPLPSRQASGSRGGHASRRAASLRRTQRARGLSYQDPTSSAPRSEPFSGYASSDWEEASAYGSPSSCPSRIDTPFSQASYSPYTMPKDSAHFSPMLGMASHLATAPRSYASSPITPNTPAFVGADTGYNIEQVPAESLFALPSMDERIDPNISSEHQVWMQNGPMDMEFLNELSQYPDGA